MSKNVRNKRSNISSSGSGSNGDVIGPSLSPDHGVARFTGTTGKILDGFNLILQDGDDYHITLDASFDDVVRCMRITDYDYTVFGSYARIDSETEHAAETSCFGGNSGNSITSASWGNTLIGAGSGLNMTGLSRQNTCVGARSLRNANVGADYNTILGFESAATMTNGTYNFIAGYGAAYNLFSASNNIIITNQNYKASNLITGNNNIYFAGVGPGNESNAIRVGNSTHTLVQLSKDFLSDLNNVMVGSQAGEFLDKILNQGNLFVGFQAGLNVKGSSICTILGNTAASLSTAILANKATKRR